MLFLPDGPDIPSKLVTLQEKGQTIFVCGAGVSKTVGLPLFRGLVERVYESLNEDWNLYPAEREGMRQDGRLTGQYDRVLRCLERRLAASDRPRSRGMRERIRAAVRNALAPPDNVDLTNHLALLELSRGADGQTRLLTTNFDTLFERAWHDQHGTPIASHAGAAMPQPMASGFDGVLHLHGRLEDANATPHLEETELVLTSAEFGDAYLRSGWASRYVYDLARALTIVLVGYQADDPPMRYLLEVLEADRERYPDLRQVYAFAACEDGEEETVTALWRAKGIEPILYLAENHDHSRLYQTLQEWRRYADDPTAWRRARLEALLAQRPRDLTELQTEECVELLRHGDASQLLGDILPPADWLPFLASHRVFANGTARPGEWIAARINDADMIRACSGVASLDQQSLWQVDRAVDAARDDITPVRLDAWRLLLATKRSPPKIEYDDEWFRSVRTIRQGQTGYEARRLSANLLRPQLEVGKPYHLYEEAAEGDGESLHDLLRIDFRSANHPPPEEILEAWPQSIDQEVALFRTLDRALLDALEEASDVGFLERPDRASFDVPSVAQHPQNAHRSGFYPIVRALADLWERIAERDRDRARSLIEAWKVGPFLLPRRLYLYALASQAVFSADEAAAAVLDLSDDVFWLTGAQVEIMRLLVNRWPEFSEEDRDAIETRLREGMRRDLFPQDAFEDEQHWESVNDSAVFRRLTRIEAAGGELSADSHRLINEISGRHNTWAPRPGDRDDFPYWSESRQGPQGHPERLAEIADDALVQEAMRLQQESQWEEGDIWRLVCSADPNRALRGLRLEADADRWNADAWRSLFWEAGENERREFQFELAEQLTRMPDDPLTELMPSVTNWLQKRREILASEDQPGGPRFFALWDRCADLTFQDVEDDEAENGGDLLTSALNEPGGIIAWALLDSLGASRPDAGSGLDQQHRPRFDRIANAEGRSGLLARVYLSQALSYLDLVDPEWVNASLVSHFAWENLEAPALWHARAHDRVGSARLFNALKPAMLEAFARGALSDHDLEGLVAMLLSVAIWKRRGEAAEYGLTSAEIKRALTVGPPAARRNASWNLWRLMGEADGEPASKGERWRTLIGPIFEEIWPLDAGLRAEDVSRNLVLMALECDDAFPEAVEAILDIVLPYQLYELSHSLRLEQQHDELVGQHPIAFVKLVNAIIDNEAYPVPGDLASLLQECLDANPAVEHEPSYVRLYGLRRLQSA